MRDLILDFRRGGGSVPEVVHGIVRIWGTEVRPNATSLVLTTETTLKLSEGKATLANAQTSGTGPLYEWAYIIQVEPFCGRNYRFYVAIPDGTGPINLVDLPKLNPITGEGFYLDIEEWEALYGDLPNRVDALETSQATQDGKITNLEARPIGNTTMRVDTTVGTRVFITDGVTEHMVSGDTGWRDISSLVQLETTGTLVVLIRRVNERVYLSAENLTLTVDPPAHATILAVPVGFAPYPVMKYGPQYEIKSDLYSSGREIRSGSLGAGMKRFQINFPTRDAWPTTLPGTPA